MYILIRQLISGTEINVLCCEKKKPIIEYLKKRKCEYDYSQYGDDYYWNKRKNESYYIEKIKVLKMPNKNEIYNKYWNNIYKNNSPKLVKALYKSFDKLLNNQENK